MFSEDFIDIKMRVMSYPQRLWNPVMDVFRGGYWILGYVKDHQAFPAYKKEDIEYAVWAINIVPELVEEIERLKKVIQSTKAPPESVL